MNIRKSIVFALVIAFMMSIVLTGSGVLTQQATATTAGTTATAQTGGYVKAGDFVTQLLQGAKISVDNGDYWGKAVKMGIIPAEVKKDRTLTRAQAAYIVWKFINAVPELKDKNIPVKVEVLSPVDYTLWSRGELGANFRGAYVPWYRATGWTSDKPIYTSAYRVIRTYNIVVIDKYYKDGTVKTVHVWDRLRDYDPAKDWAKLLQKFMKEQPSKVKFDFPQDRMKALVWKNTPSSYTGWNELPEKKQLYTLYRLKPGDRYYTKEQDGQYYFWTMYKTSSGDVKYGAVILDFLQFGKYKSKNPEDWNLTAELNPIFNESLNRWLMSLPRQYPLDYTRFKYICVDFNSVPKLYQEALLRLADLGIVTPDVNIDKNVFKTKFVDIASYNLKNAKPKVTTPDIRFNAGRVLTQKEASEMIARVFDESRRKVVDEMTFDYSKEKNPETVDKYGNTLYDSFGNPDMTTELLMFQHSGTSITLRVDELWQLFYAQYLMEKYPDAPMLFTNAYYTNPNYLKSPEKRWYKLHVGFGYLDDLPYLGTTAQYQPGSVPIPLINGVALSKQAEDLLVKKKDISGYYSQNNTKR